MNEQKLRPMKREFHHIVIMLVSLSIMKSPDEQRETEHNLLSSASAKTSNETASLSYRKPVLARNQLNLTRLPDFNRKFQSELVI